MNLKDRLFQIAEYHGLSIAEFERIAGLSNGYLKNFKGSLGSNKMEYLLRAFPNISPSWLLLGEGEMIKPMGNGIDPELVKTDPTTGFNYTPPGAPADGDGKEDEEEDRIKVYDSPGKDGVPYYDEDFLLGFDELVPHGWEHPEYYIRMPGYEKATMWCNASGHSMEPEISNGDIIAMKRIEDFSFLPYGDVYGIITTNGMRTIKRLGRGSRDGFYKLIPTNKEYDVQEIPIEKIALVYRVMGAMKAF